MRAVIRVFPTILTSKTIKLEGDASTSIHVSQSQETDPLYNQARISFANLYASSTASAKEATDDAASISYINGLPVIVIADGALGSNPHAPQKICNEFLTQLLPGYTLRLTDEEDPNDVMQALLQTVNKFVTELNTQSDEFMHNVRLSFACAICYYADQARRLSCIGVGSDMIAVYRDGRYLTVKPAENIVANDQVTAIIEKQQAIPHQKVLLPNTDLENIQCHTITLEENDVIVGLTDGSFEFIEDLSLVTKPIVNSDQTIIERGLPETLDIIPENLFTHCHRLFSAKKYSMINQTEPYHFGDDALIAMARIPEEKILQQIQSKSDLHTSPRSSQSRSPSRPSRRHKHQSSIGSNSIFEQPLHAVSSGFSERTPLLIKEPEIASDSCTCPCHCSIL